MKVWSAQVAAFWGSAARLKNLLESSSGKTNGVCSHQHKRPRPRLVWRYRFAILAYRRFRPLGRFLKMSAKIEPALTLMGLANGQRIAEHNIDIGYGMLCQLLKSHNIREKSFHLHVPRITFASWWPEYYVLSISIWSMNCDISAV
jgi:hypothetical protein